MEPGPDITQLLMAARSGDDQALDSLFSAVYEDLRRVSHNRLFGSAPGQTLDTTALVHETYLKLIDRSRIQPVDRKHFFATAARAMRQIIVDHARTASAAKRGGPHARATSAGLSQVLDQGELDARTRAAEILAIEDAMAHLAGLNERLSRVVELRFFAGYPVEEVAEIMGTSVRTVKRDWRAARAVLFQRLGGGSGP